MSDPHAPSPLRVCFVVAVPETAAAFLTPHIKALARDYAVDIVADFSGIPTPVTVADRHISIEIRRRIEPFRDVRALTRLFQLFRRERYNIVHSVTPKAGLLAMLAAKLAGVDHRVHWFTGQVWATRAGLPRAILRTADRLTAACATNILVDSESQLRFLISEGVVNPNKASVLGSGSICGVDTRRFAPNAEVRAHVRAQLGIDETETVVVFLGRLNREKGVLDLAEAMCEVEADRPVRLVLGGSDEESLAPRIQDMLATKGLVCSALGHVSHPESLLCASDIFCLPSHREGFGLSVIEAAACGIPAVASNVYGLTDAVVEEETGLLFPVGDARALARCISELVSNPELRNSMGSRARTRVITEFEQERLTSELSDFYQEILDLPTS